MLRAYGSGRRFIWVLVCLVALWAVPGHTAAVRLGLPAGFVYLTDVAPEILLDLRYYGSDNFVGATIDGYRAPVAIVSKQAAAALKKASDVCARRGYALKIFDAYRPKSAVDHFVRWARDRSDMKTKARFYPDTDKSQLFKQGYIAGKSGHSRGSTVDLTLVDRADGKELDMGSPFDFFGPVSHHGASLIRPEQAANRAVLKSIMQESGFKAYSKEWWHYTLENEPFPQTYFDFAVE